MTIEGDDGEMEMTSERDDDEMEMTSERDDDEMEVEELPIVVRESNVNENYFNGEEEDENVQEEEENENGYNEEETANGGEDEDLNGRYEYEIEEEVADFVDEDYRERHTIPESSDDEEDELTLRKRRMGKRKANMLALGTDIYTGYQFKEAVLNYALSKGRNIKQDRWDKTKISYRCGIAGKCKWRVYCSFDKPRRKWVIKTRYASHSCTRNGKCKLLKGPVIASLFLDKLQQDPNLMPEKIQCLIKENWKLVSTRNQYQTGRIRALKWLEREYEEQFAYIRGYAQEILYTNPGTTAIVDTYRNVTGEDVFDKFYVCIASLKNSWSGSCRPIIGLDGTFLKAAVKGVLLTAVGHDANNQIYPIAWAVVQKENGPNWLWFINQLKSDLNLQTGLGIVMISDRSKGLINAVKEVLPSAEHRMCVKHIVENLKNGGHANKDLIKPMVWNLTWSYTKVEFEENRRKLQSYNLSLYNDVMKEKPETWSLAFFKLGSCCEDVDNNSTESFNSTITKARAKAMVPMLEMIRRLAMARIAKRRIKSEKWEGRCSKYVKKTLELEKEEADKCTSIPATHGVHEVDLHRNSYTVNTTNQTCTCGKYQVTGIPCEHAYGAMLNEGLNADNFVSPWFSKEMWELNYNTNMNPVRGPRFWIKRGGYRLVVAPPEPDLPGRKKNSKKIKKRIKGKHESPKKKKKQVEKLPRTGRIIHCSNCGEEGHNYTGCKIHPKKKPRKMGEISEGTSSHNGETISLTQPSQICLTQESQP